MDNKIVREAKLLIVYKSGYDNSWYTSITTDPGLPLSNSIFRSIVPELNSVDIGLDGFLKRTLCTVDTPLYGWYLLTSEPQLRFFANVGFFRRLYSIGKPVVNTGVESVAVIIVLEHATPQTKS